MAVIISGMNKPKKCSECPLCHMSINGKKTCQITSETVPSKTDDFDIACPIIQMPLRFKLTKI